MNEWYLVLRKGDVEKAKRLKLTVDLSVEEDSDDDCISIYYSILEFWYENSKMGDNKLNFEMNETAVYFYHYFQGVLQFSDKRYEDCLAHFLAAENKLEAIEDDLIKAHFYRNLAEVKMALNHSLDAIRYSIKAMKIYAAEEEPCLEAMCQLIIAKCYALQKNSVMAMNYIQKSMNLSQSAQDIHMQRKALQMYNALKGESLVAKKVSG